MEKLNHLKSRMECGFSDIFSRHICSTVTETIGVTNYAASFGAKNVQKTTSEAAEVMLGPWNQQLSSIPFSFCTDEDLAFMSFLISSYYSCSPLGLLLNDIIVIRIVLSHLLCYFHVTLPEKFQIDKRVSADKNEK